MGGGHSVDNTVISWEIGQLESQKSCPTMSGDISQKLIRELRELFGWRRDWNCGHVIKPVNANIEWRLIQPQFPLAMRSADVSLSLRQSSDAWPSCWAPKTQNLTSTQLWSTETSQRLKSWLAAMMKLKTLTDFLRTWGQGFCFWAWLLVRVGS